MTLTLKLYMYIFCTNNSHSYVILFPIAPVAIVPPPSSSTTTISSVRPSAPLIPLVLPDLDRYMEGIVQYMEGIVQYCTAYGGYCTTYGGYCTVYGGYCTAHGEGLQQLSCVLGASQVLMCPIVVHFFFNPFSPCRRPSMRRGMLMTVLHQYAVEQPVWRGKPGERYAYGLRENT